MDPLPNPASSSSSTPSPPSLHPLPSLPPASQLDYPLPDDRIAKRPAEPRDSSLLLVSDASSSSPSSSSSSSSSQEDDPYVYDATFRDLPSFLPSDTLLVLNQSRVITARLLMHKENTGGKAEVLCISPIEPSWDPAVALAAPSGQSVWRCMIGGKNIKAGSRLLLTYTHTDTDTSPPLTLTATVEAREGKDGIVRFSWQSPDPHLQQQSFGAILENVGKIPLPPYMNRASDASDIKDYQTVYAKAEGSVAAPTAGLHFTQPLLEALQKGEKKIDPCYLTLHVGAGTFQPVSGEDVGAHAMHWERVNVPLSTLEQLISACGGGGSGIGGRRKERPIVPVGTTSVRTLESLYWWGVKLLKKQLTPTHTSVTDMSLGQWEPYHHGVAAAHEHTHTHTHISNSNFPPALEALEALKYHAQKEGVDSVGGETQLMVAPGYRFALCDGLITNFHQPRSTLLLLVSALMGGLGPVHRIYRHALLKGVKGGGGGGGGGGYRFLSFGDSNLMVPPRRCLLPVRWGRGGGGKGGGGVQWPRTGGGGGGGEEGWRRLKE